MPSINAIKNMHKNMHDTSMTFRADVIFLKKVRHSEILRRKIYFGTIAWINGGLIYVCKSIIVKLFIVYLPPVSSVYAKQYVV
jgi:hypothetical protein